MKRNHCSSRMSCINVFVEVMKNHKRRGRMRMAVEGAEKLLEACYQIVNDQGKRIFRICLVDFRIFRSNVAIGYVFEPPN